jgi:metal-responsive CopG/Arc/MetJ family transcriptional regulator
MKNISLKIPDALFQKLLSAARKRGESNSAIIRLALDHFLSKERPDQDDSCLELAKDLLGVIDAPRDLSYEKDHLGGYGA